VGRVARLWFGLRGWSARCHRHRRHAHRRLWERVEATIFPRRSVGAAIGYRWIFFVVELNVLLAYGHVRAFDENYDLSGYVIAPSYGVMGTF
jgi:hypothetical protein